MSPAKPWFDKINEAENKEIEGEGERGSERGGEREREMTGFHITAHASCTELRLGLAEINLTACYPIKSHYGALIRIKINTTEQ